MHTEFHNQFFSQSMHQIFNREGDRFNSDETESAVVKYLRAKGQFTLNATQGEMQ